jgi:hypothetical protein
VETATESTMKRRFAFGAGRSVQTCKYRVTSTTEQEWHQTMETMEGAHAPAGQDWHAADPGDGLNEPETNRAGD